MEINVVEFAWSVPTLVMDNPKLPDEIPTFISLVESWEERGSGVCCDQRVTIS